MDSPKDKTVPRVGEKEPKDVPAQQADPVPAAGKSAARPSEAERLRALLDEDQQDPAAPRPPGKDSF
jgi:hypothetical protein